MKINFYTNNINFGYDKTYHDKLHKQLSNKKQLKDLADQFIAEDKSLLELEDKIVELEKTPRKTKTTRYDKLTEFLIDKKQTLAFHMASSFNSLKYCDNVIDYYLKEMNNLKDEFAIMWRYRLCQQLASYTTKDFPELNPTSKKTSQTQTPETQATVTQEDINKTVEEIRKEAIAEYKESKDFDLLTKFTPLASSPKGFCDVAGLEEEKQRFQEEIIDYIQNPQQAKLDEEEYGIKMPRGYLFYGPPGCGKTFIAEALAIESGLTMFKMDVSKIGSKYVNQTAKNIENAFNYLESYVKKQNQPVLLFMDEVDALVKDRSASDNESGENLKATTTILKFMQEARDKGIIFIASTNKYDLLDDAFISRFDGQQYFGLPDEKQIKTLLVKTLSKRTKGTKLANNENEISSLAKDLEGYSNRSIVFIIDKASKLAKRNSRADISSNDIRKAIEESDFEKIDEKKYKKQGNNNKKIGFIA